MNLGFDIDGVISDFVKTFAELVKKRYGLTLTETKVYCHDLDLVLGISKEERSGLIRETLLEDLSMNLGARDSLLKLHSNEHKIFLLTARPHDLVNITEEWLKRKGIPYTQLVQLNEGEKHFADVSLDLVVEDNLEDAIGYSKKVRNILVYDHPWNQSLNVRHLFKRVYNWNDILKEIEQLEDTSLSKTSSLVS